MTLAESDLRAALRERAAQVPANTTLTQIDYHPRTRRLRPRVAIGGGLATAAGTIAAVLSLAGGASSAFAGWTPQPTTPTAAQLAAARAYCATDPTFPGLSLKLVDARGPFVLMIYANGSSNHFCSTGPGFQNTSGWSTSPPVKVSPGQLFLWTDHVSTDQEQAFGTMIAQAADDVSAAKVTLDDGSRVTATVENGWMVAWWPGDHHLASAQLTTPSGTETQTFAKYPCDVDKCHGGPHGGAPGGGPGGG